MNSNKEEDLLLDESFLDWYFKRSEKEITKWNKMIAADKECQQLVEQALLLLNEMVVGEKNIPYAIKWKAEQKLMSSLKNVNFSNSEAHYS